MPSIGLHTTYLRQRRQTRRVPYQKESRSKALPHSGLLFPGKARLLYSPEGLPSQTKEEPAYSFPQQSQSVTNSPWHHSSEFFKTIALHHIARIASLCVILGTKIVHFFIFKSPLSCRDSNFHFPLSIQERLK